MSFFPADKKKLKARIGAYKRALAQRNCDDGYGKRFLVGHMYLLLGDHLGALQFLRLVHQKVSGRRVRATLRVPQQSSDWRGSTQQALRAPFACGYDLTSVPDRHVYRR